MLPQCMVIHTTEEHDKLRARELYTAVKEGEFDKGYLEFSNLDDLDARGVQWIAGSKER